MKVTKVSGFTGIEHTLEIPCTQEQLDRWKAGEFIQVAMPNLSADQREFLMTGGQRGWGEVFSAEDDDE